MCRIMSIALSSLLLSISGAVRADDSTMDSLAADATKRMVENAPRLSLTELPASAQRSAPGFRADSAELSYRWWSRGEPTRWGFGVGSVVQVTR